MVNQNAVSEAVKTNDYRTSLVALRDTLAAELDSSEVPAVVKAQLAKQLRETLIAIESIPNPDKYFDTELDKILSGAD